MSLTNGDLKLKKPSLSDTIRETIGIDLGANFDKIDSKVTKSVDNINNIQSELGEHKLDYNEHLNSTMPHKSKDLQGDKVYTFGLQLSAEGNPQIIYEEVI